MSDGELRPRLRVQPWLADILDEWNGKPAVSPEKPIEFVVGESYSEDEIRAMVPREQRVGFPGDEDDVDEDEDDVDGYDRNGAVDGFGQVHSDAEGDL